MPIPPRSDVAQDALDKIFEEAVPQPPSDPGELPPPEPVAPHNILDPVSELFDGGDPGQYNHPSASEINAPIFGEAPPDLPNLPTFDDSSGDVII